MSKGNPRIWFNNGQQRTIRRFKMEYLLIPWGLSLGIIAGLWIWEDASAGSSDFLQQARRTSCSRPVGLSAEDLEKF
jgi:hypothetical protein